ncbi:hypothetical protein NQ314_011845 [Rhamnusium bicolor]|uniref:Uncharacterized protein n=1 Tax=Rhamnusium bicolor TaxID=1586634 RepID=A0AAV8XEQ2_9CUCU|nr:hypothetical protein NQ314_011845 [Rhamnusium bicolor]
MVAHVHHYTKISGFDADLFMECNTSLKEIMESYREIENMKPANIPRLTALKKHLTNLKSILL